MYWRTLALIPVALAAACSTDRAAGPEAAPDLAAVKFWEAGATVAWTARADALIAARPTNAIRLHTYLTMAQLRAAEAAIDLPGPHPPISAAIGGASAAVLGAFFPLDLTQIEADLDAQQAADPWPGAKHADFAAGEAVGREVAAEVLAFAQGDQFGLTDPLLPPWGPVPIGPQYWIYTGTIARGLLGARPLFLTSSDQLRPPPPPAIDSPEYQTALAEVRDIVANRTAEQLAIAVDWHAGQSPVSNIIINTLARELIVSHRKSDAEAARILFLANAAAWDALIGCFDAKYTYWFIRPAQADPSIVTAFTTPAHPSYPSAHSCITGSMTAVLAGIFPDAAARLTATAEEAGLSRVYAGIHYRFDSQTGLALGRAAAALALAADLDEIGP